MYPNDSPPLPLSIRSDWPPLAEVPFANLFFGGVSVAARKRRADGTNDARIGWTLCTHGLVRPPYPLVAVSDSTPALCEAAQPERNSPVLFVVIMLTVAVRVAIAVGQLPLTNFMPLTAIAFSSSACLDRRRDWLVPVFMLFASDVILNMHYGEAAIGSWTVIAMLCLAMFALAGRWVTGRRSVLLTVCGSVTCTLVFYVVSNTVSYAVNADYPPGFVGWVQALTVGLPGYPPTWMFLRNSLIGDLSYTLVLVSVLSWQRTRAGLPAVPLWPVRVLEPA